MVIMSDKKSVVFVGMPGSGKSVCVEYLKDKGLSYAYFGGITIEEIKNRGLEVNEENEKLVREDLRAKEGKDVYAKRIIKQIEGYFEQNQNHVVVDGLYSWTEYKLFKEKFGDNAIIIAVVAPRGLRHERLASRSVRPLVAEEADERDYAEIENIEKGGPIANADYFLCNDGSVEQLTDGLQKLLAQLNII
jgi:dephospho-CoA kinase